MWILKKYLTAGGLINILGGTEQLYNDAYHEFDFRRDQTYTYKYYLNRKFYDDSGRDRYWEIKSMGDGKYFLSSASAGDKEILALSEIELLLKSTDGLVTYCLPVNTGEKGKQNL